MKATGIVRKVDVLGRIVIPIELRETLGIAVKDPVEIFTAEDLIILKRYEPLCFICGEGKSFVSHRDKLVCMECVEAINRMK